MTYKKVLGSCDLDFPKTEKILEKEGLKGRVEFDDEDYKIVDFSGKNVQVKYIKLRIPPRDPYLHIEGDQEDVDKLCKLFKEEMPDLKDITNQF